MDTTTNSISFLITHYHRAEDLLKCINAIRMLELENYEIVVSDDGSDATTLETISTYHIDTLVRAERNGGLASNINKGIAVCKGTFILYCQEDFLLDSNLKKVLPRLLSYLHDRTADMIRLTSYFRFNKVRKLNEDIFLIPRFSLANFFQNYYRYSDHPYIVKSDFYDKHGYYLDYTSGGYGETEYSVRLSRSSVKIAITSIFYARGIVGSSSVMMNEEGRLDKSQGYNKKIIKIARAFRLYFEWLVYNKNRRGLITYTNERKTGR